ncbi:hypothetical protein BHM03_00048299 [Ensete ventricosum]|nr:hypothetical protein BHM03_00048299 [Ensete ventricosum]
MKSCHDIALVISEEALESIRECYSIPEGYAHRAPSPEQRTYQPQPSEISLSVDALEAGLRFPLHPTIVKCLRWWRISSSQMAPNSWRYLIAFLGECREAGIVPNRTLFFACFRLYKSQGGYYLTAQVGFKNPWMPGGKGAPAVDPESAQPEVEVMHPEASRKRPAGSSAPDPTATGRPRKWVKIAVRRHKAHRDEGSSRRVNRERESEVSMGDTSPTYCRPKSMRDLCGMRVQEDDKGYYVLQMADWAPRDSSAAMQARWSNLLYQSRVWDDSEAASEFDRGVLHLTLAKDLYTLPSEVLIARAAKQIVLADNAKLKSGLDELSSRLDKADKEPNKLREGLVESQRQLKEQKANHRKANDELLKLMRENESLKADLPGKSITDYKQSRPKDGSKPMETCQEFDDSIPLED